MLSTFWYRRMADHMAWVRCKVAMEMCVYVWAWKTQCSWFKLYVLVPMRKTV